MTKVRRLLAFLLAVSLATPAWAADQWNIATVTGTGSQTGTLIYPFVHSSTTASAITRYATSLTNALTVYTVTGAGAITATNYTPANPSNVVTIQALGGDSTRVFVGGGSVWLEYASLSDLSSWTTALSSNSVNDRVSGLIFTSPAGGGKYRYFYQSSSANRLQAKDLTLPTTVTHLANNKYFPENEFVSYPVNSTYSAVVAMDSSAGKGLYDGYNSGASFLFDVDDTTASASGPSKWFPAFSMNGLLFTTTIKKAWTNTYYIRAINSSGTLTEVVNDSATAYAPGCDWDPTGSLRRGWWVGTADGKLYATNSISAPTSISNNATYDMTTTALQGSTPLTMICGLDVDQDGDAADNPLVFLANGKLAYWGEPATSGGPLAPQRAQRGPFNNFPFRGP